MIFGEKPKHRSKSVHVEYSKNDKSVEPAKSLESPLSASVVEAISRNIYVYVCIIHCTYFTISYAHLCAILVPYELNLIRSNERKRNGCKIVNLPAPNISSLVQTGLKTFERFKFELIKFTRIANLLCIRSSLPGTRFPFSDRLFHPTIR